MKLVAETTSLCQTCYRVIPADIVVAADGVVMHKACPEHGAQAAIVERDPLFYMYVKSVVRSPSIYDGYFLDVTRRCNLRCKFCFYQLEKSDPAGEYSIESLVSEARANECRAPFIITGGEPTTRKDIAAVIEAVRAVGPAELLSNGHGLSSREGFNSIMPLIMSSPDVANLNLSLHVNETDDWKKVLEFCREDGIRIESALIVIDSKEEFWKAIELAKSCADVVMSFRIKAASRIWAEQKPEKIFTSDMMGWLEESGRPVSMILDGTRHNKVSIINVMYDGVWLMLVSWYETANVDLQDIECAPFYRARNGEVANFVTACLINEGMEKGWMKGRRMK